MKLKYLILSSLLLLTSCSGSTKDLDSLKILTPVGAPAVAFYNYAKNSNYSTNGKPVNIVANMTKNSDVDIVVIDTVSGIQAINSGSPYLLAATITFGNFYLASTGNDTNNTLDEDDTIVLFGQNATPDYLFHYLFSNQYDSNIEYVDNVQDASKCLASGKNLITGNEVDYVFIAQPALYSVLNNTDAKTYGKASVYLNIQEEYARKTNNLSLMQASVFIKNSLSKSIANEFLQSLESDINEALATPSLVVEGMSQISDEEASLLYGINKNVAKKVIEDNNSLGLGFVRSYSYKSDIDNYISLFGMENTDEKIYFR